MRSNAVVVVLGVVAALCVSVQAHPTENPVREELLRRIRKYTERDTSSWEAKRQTGNALEEYRRTVQSEGTNAPQQIHLAYAGRSQNGESNAMAVVWVTVNQTKNSIVKYGTESGNYSHQVTGQSSSYLVTWDHVAIMPNLQLDTRYYYMVGDEEAGFSEEYTFVTAPKNDPERTTRIITIGDMGTWESSNVRSAISRVYDDFEFIWHLGDIAYADDAFLHYPLQFKYEATWNFYLNWFQNVSAYKPYMTCPGNHEAECHSPACLLDYDNLAKPLCNFTAYRNRFRMPGPESGGNTNMWHSFSHGNIHFININSETNYPDAPKDEHFWTHNGNFSGDQLQWLEDELKEANKNRDVRPWIVVAGHRPMYTVQSAYKNGTREPGSSTKVMSRAFEKLLYDYKVDIYFSGHQHAYERQYPVYMEEPENSYHNPRDPVHIVNGAGGDSEGHSDYGNASAPWNAVWNTADFGYGIITTYNSTTLHWAFYAAVNDTKIDEVTLFKKH